jgi:3-isopropylmalate/(R)-2-methylmalate dehydratase small subunit
MQKFKQLSGVVAPLPMVNIDTDKIIPKQFLTTVQRSGLGKHVFNDLRFTLDGKENPDFVLNKPAYRDAKILIAGANFGCGSSREHAPWALMDYGIHCIVAPSFADIFFNNCFKNGLLPIVLPQEQVDRLVVLAGQPGTVLTVDLEAQRVTGSDGLTFDFTIDPFRKHCLLNGLDDIGLTEQYLPDIEAFEAKRKVDQPWV